MNHCVTLKNLKTISLIQPWATFVMMRLKALETRSWQTKHRGTTGIHASLRRPLCAQLLYYSDDLRKALRESLGADYHLLPSFDDLPRGCILGTVNLSAITPTEDCPWPHDGVEGLLGDYSPDRYAWLMTCVEPFLEPVPMKGGLSLWNAGTVKARAA